MKIRAYTVSPSLPRRLFPLMNVSRNIYWCWMPEAVELFRRIDIDLWESTGHNPVRLLGEVSQQRLEDLSKDESFLAHMDNVAIELEDYQSTRHWFAQNHPDMKGMNICYFSAEFGLHESLPIYSGGLGLLAGDHLKAASDLGLPLTGIGLLYRQGYFRQYLNIEGWQQESYPENDFSVMPFSLLKDKEGKPVLVSVHLPGREVVVQCWSLNVGRVRLLMLDTNLLPNRPEDREITSQLYGGDLEMRLKQEIVLGIGGIRLLRAIGIIPNVCHMNEGHSAFLALERIRFFVEEHNLDFQTAQEIVSASNVFTTHTPVPAGNDVFPPDMVDHYFRDYYNNLHLNREQFLGLGRQDPFDRNEQFCMTVLAIRLAAHRNGVSKLHGQVSRKMWERIWPGLNPDEIPIGHITNGVHIPGWISHDLAQLYTRYLGPRWIMNSQDHQAWEGITRVPDAELWRTHERRRERLVGFARRRLHNQEVSRGAIQTDIQRVGEVLDPEALTLGFARRYATYKRGALLFSDPDRLDRILNDKDRPVQIIFAGKAHPQDSLGKEVIKTIIQYAREPRFRNRVVFIEDYDINVASHLVQGVDVWINTPRRPLEASGTSGMKAAANGVINVSILDGWWDEAYNKDNGWAIGNGEEYADHAYQDEVESRALFDLLEEEIVPMFYKRGADGLPRQWLALMKQSILSNASVFNTNRMVIDYLDKFYKPGAFAREKLMMDDLKPARELAEWKNSIRRRWAHIQIHSVDEMDPEREAALTVGGLFPVKVLVRLEELKPDEIAVEVCYGRLDSVGKIRDDHSVRLSYTEQQEDGQHVYEGQVPLDRAGRCGFSVRVLPYHTHMTQRFEPGLIIWE